MPNEGVSVDRLRALRQLAKSQGLHEVIESFPESFMSGVLRTKTPSEALKTMQGVEIGLARLRELEQRADSDILEQLFLGGQMFSRGLTQCGTTLVYAFRVSGDHWIERTLHFFWIMLLAMRRRPNRDRGFVYIGDLCDTSIWDTNPSFAKEVGKLNNLLFPCTLPGAKICFLLKNDRLQSFANWFLSRSPGGYREALEMPKSRKSLLEKIANPDDLPDKLVPGYGSPFQASFETLGDCYLVLEKKGFATLTTRDVYLPQQCKGDSGASFAERQANFRSSQKRNFVARDESNSPCGETAEGTELKRRHWPSSMPARPAREATMPVQATGRFRYHKKFSLAAVPEEGDEVPDDER